MSGVNSGEEHVRALLAKIEVLKPHFGRAQADLEAICQRGRNRDYRGVLQNTRLVVETLLRAMMAKDKSQQPGKQTLEQLLAKMNNELPTPVAVHARTIQAWGNVGAHDHATDLFAPGVEVKPEEAVAALNALVPILEWYRAEHLGAPSVPAPAAAASVAVGASLSPEPASPRSNIAGKVIAGGIAVSVIGLAAVIMVTQAERAESSIAARQAIDAYYAAQKEPAPPDSCRSKEASELAALADASVWLTGGKPRSARPEDQKAEERLEQAKITSGEGKMFLARSRLYAGVPNDAVIDAAEAALQDCESPIALATLGSAHLFGGKPEEAKKAYLRASALAPDYAVPKVNLGLIALGAGEAEQAIALFDEVLARDPHHVAARQAAGRAQLLFGIALKEKGDADAATKAFCRAKELGEEKATTFCP